MSVIVLGMEMPKRCLDCRLYADEYGCTAATAEQARQAYFDCKENGTSDEEAMYKLCPLRPLPEKHGRLGDIDAIMEEIKNSRIFKGDSLIALMDIVDGARTVVEAEGD